MGVEQPNGKPSGSRSELDQVVEEVVSEAHLAMGALLPEERQYLKDHALRKPMGVLHIWALGVGVVITGEYFGWNPGLKEGGPIGMLIASLFVCALYMLWVLGLSELSVSMPFAGGPLAYGRRAVGPWLGFVMGWSMFLEALFATIGTAMATGGYIYFILNILFEGVDQPLATTVSALVCVVLFAAVQWLGAKEQAKAMEWMTYGAILGLVWFWVACLPGVRFERIFTQPVLTHGWTGVIKAIPFAIWWLVMIETVALAPEESHEPHRTIPHGITMAQITLIILVILTWFVVSGAGSDPNTTGDAKVSFPLPLVYEEVWPRSPHLIAFCVVAIFGMIASYNGMIYAVSRQSFALGRAGYLPSCLGHVHILRRTPDVSIFIWSLVVAGFVIWGHFNEAAIMVTVLTCNLTALIWYVLAMVCLFILRAKAPDMPRPYKTPFYPWLPLLVIGMSLFAAGAYVYGLPTEETESRTWYSDYQVVLLTLAMYAVGLAYYFGIARRKLASAAPEELAARAAAGHSPGDMQVSS
jgi:ethanolamine permease